MPVEPILTIRGEALRMASSALSALLVSHDSVLQDQRLPQHRQHCAVLLPIGVFLRLNHGGQFEDSNTVLAQLVQDGAGGEILVGTAGSDLAEEVESAELGQEEMRPQGLELRQVWLDVASRRVPIPRLELLDEAKQAVEVFWR